MSKRREQGFFLRQEGNRKATAVRQESEKLVEDDKGDKIVHGRLYRWIYLRKMRTSDVHLFGFVLRCHFIFSCMDV